MTEENDLAYPFKYALGVAYGLTKRELFAAMAMQGLCLQVTWDYSAGNCNAALADRSVILADALIEALNEGKEKP